MRPLFLAAGMMTVHEGTWAVEASGVLASSGGGRVRGCVRQYRAPHACVVPNFCALAIAVPGSSSSRTPLILFRFSGGCSPLRGGVMPHILALPVYGIPDVNAVQGQSWQLLLVMQQRRQRASAERRRGLSTSALPTITESINPSHQGRGEAM